MNFRVFTESCAFFSMVFLTFKAFCSFDTPFDSILKKYRCFATLHYSLVATSAVFTKLKQLKAISSSNTHTHTLTDYSNPRYAPMHSEVNYIV